MDYLSAQKLTLDGIDILETLKNGDINFGMMATCIGLTVYEGLLCFIQYDAYILSGELFISWWSDLLYFINRTAGITVALCSFLILCSALSFVPIPCEALLTCSKVSTLAIAVCSAFVLGMRCWRIMDRPFWFTALSVFLVSAQVACFIPALMKGPVLPTIARGLCTGPIATDVKSVFYSVGYGVTSMINFLYLFLSIRRLRKADSRTLRSSLFSSKRKYETVASKLTRHGVVYFALNLVFSIPLIVSQAVQKNIAFHSIIQIPCLTGISILTGRMIINYRDSDRSNLGIFYIGGHRIKSLKTASLAGGIEVCSTIVTHDDDGYSLDYYFADAQAQEIKPKLEIEPTSPKLLDTLRRKSQIRFTNQQKPTSMYESSSDIDYMKQQESQKNLTTDWKPQDAETYRGLV